MILKISSMLLLAIGFLITQPSLSKAEQNYLAIEENRVCSEAAFFDVKEKAETRSFFDKILKRKNYAQFHLCARYMAGCGTFANVVKGGVACQDAADSGVAEASLYLANLYHYGKNDTVVSFPVHFKKAEKYYKLYMKQSTDNVSSDIYKELSDLYRKGDSYLDQDSQRAEKYKKMSEEKKDKE